MRSLIYIIAAMITAASLFAQDAELTNYKSGIDVVWGGTKGVDYMEEYLYHDKLVDDHKVVYIRDTTQITMDHNERNAAAGIPSTNLIQEIIGEHGRDGVPSSGDEGIIRYKIDRDRQYNYVWADNWARVTPGRVLPAYSTPFTLASQVYTDQWACTATFDGDYISILSYAVEEAKVKDGVVNTTVVHGIPNGTAVTFPYLSSDGAGLSTGTTYYTRDATGMKFKVATSPGGAAVDITSNYREVTSNSTGSPIYGSIVRLVAAPPVVGTTGPISTASYGSMTACYFRGILDAFGDEWHTLNYADDSNVLCRTYAGRELDMAWYADDGKHVMLVVNPKTPGLTVRATGDGQFFTTPPKAYWTPKVSAQTTYFNAGTGTVTFEIRDLYGNNVFYRIGGGSFINAGASSVTLTQADFASGSNTLQYYYAGNAAYTKTRTVVKNPTHPSLAESHGNFLWAEGAEYATIQNRVARAPYNVRYDRYKGNREDSGQVYWDAFAMQGKRYLGAAYNNANAESYALKNAFVAKIEGSAYKIASSPKTHMRYAIEMLLDHQRTIDPLGFEMQQSADAIPSREITYRGYYDCGAIRQSVFAYDIVAGNFRSDQVAGGMTAIEDHFIRNYMAAFVYEQKMWGAAMTVIGAPRMWGSIRMNTGAYVAMFMPEYSSPVYGTSGFGSVQTKYPLCPYQDDQYTWKEALFDIGGKTKKFYPNFKFEGQWGYNGPLVPFEDMDVFLHDNQRTNALYGPDRVYGDWAVKIGYYSEGLCGMHMQIWANLAKRRYGVTDPILEASFTRAANEQLWGWGDNPPYPQTAPAWYPLSLLLNSNWPAIAGVNQPRITQVGSTGRNSFDDLMQDAGVFGIAWMDDTYTGTPVEPTPPANPTSISVAITSNSSATITWTDNATNETYYTIERSTDNAAWTSSVQLSPNVQGYAASGLTGSTLYYWRVRAGNADRQSAWITASGTTNADEVAPEPSPAGPGTNTRPPKRNANRGAKGPL